MPDIARALADNRLLPLLPGADLGTMLPNLKAVPLVAGVALSDGVYFVASGLVSMFVLTSEGQALYTGLVGREGAAGLTGLGSPSPSVQTAVLAPGIAARISRAHFREAWSNSAAIRDLQVRYSELMIVHAQQSTACNALHATKGRLCTWLLRAHDRLPGEPLPFTQALLAEMVGVRRTTVTLLAHELQKEGLLRYSRGHIQVVSRAGLENQACECYGINQRCADAVFTATATSD
jgi:CRP-like cAMP-binding protein